MWANKICIIMISKQLGRGLSPWGLSLYITLHNQPLIDLIRCVEDGEMVGKGSIRLLSRCERCLTSEG